MWALIKEKNFFIYTECICLYI